MTGTPHDWVPDANGRKDALIQRNNSTRPEALYRRAFSILESQSDPSLLAMTSSMLADLYSRRRRNLPQAEALYSQALVAWRQAPEDDHPQIGLTLKIGLTLTSLAEVYVAQRRNAWDACPEGRQVRQIHGQVPARGDCANAEIHGGALLVGFPEAVFF